MLQYIIINILLGIIWCISWVAMIVSAYYCHKLATGDTYQLTDDQATSWNQAHSDPNAKTVTAGDQDPSLVSAYHWALWNAILGGLVLGLITLGTITLIIIVIFFSVGTEGVGDAVVVEEALSTVAEEAVSKPTISGKVMNLMLLGALVILLGLTLLNGIMACVVSYYLVHAYSFSFQDNNFKVAYNLAITSAFLNMGIFGIIAYAMINNTYDLIKKKV